MAGRCKLKLKRRGEEEITGRRRLIGLRHDLQQRRKGLRWLRCWIFFPLSHVWPPQPIARNHYCKLETSMKGNSPLLPSFLTVSKSTEEPRSPYSSRSLGIILNMTGMASDVSRRWKRRVAKEKRRLSSTFSIAVTEVSSMSGGSNRSSSLESFDQTVSFCEPIDDVLQTEESHIDRLALMVAKLEDEVKSEGRHIRQQRRKVRIHKAREEYLACLEALSTTSNASQTSTSEFFAEKNILEWEEYKLWTGINAATACSLHVCI